jgi:hypothetical protein
MFSFSSGCSGIPGGLSFRPTLIGYLPRSAPAFTPIKPTPFAKRLRPRLAGRSWHQAACQFPEV